MRLVHSRYLPAAGEERGRPAALMQIEDPAEFDVLYEYIVDSGYYGSEYYDRDIGYRDRQLVSHFFCVSEIARHLRPRRLVEVGCGRGDVLYLLQRAGIEVAGVDVSEHAVAHAWPSLASSLSCGDFRDVLGDMAAAGRCYDVVCGFDIWEHLPPSQLDSYLQAAVGVSSDDAVFYFIVPAFGKDVVFDEQFPLEFEENREAFDAREPFRFLLSDAYKGGVPALGHLTWAHTDWWLETFAGHGLVRLGGIEAQLHHFFDPLLPHSARSFYLFARDTDAAAARAEALEAQPYDRRAFTGSLIHLFTKLWWGPSGAIRFDGPLRRRFARSWRDRLENLLHHRAGRLL